MCSGTWFSLGRTITCQSRSSIRSFALNGMPMKMLMRGAGLKEAKNPFAEEFKLRVRNLQSDFERASLPNHSGLKGARIEEVFAEFLRSILPKKYSVATNQIVVDCEGRSSAETDIVIYDGSSCFKYLESFIAIETVFGAIEVKKHLTSGEAQNFRSKCNKFRQLNYRGMYSNDIETRLNEQKHHFCPPSFNLFSLTSSFSSLERYAAHVYTDQFGNDAWKNDQEYSASMTYFGSLCCSLDIGIVRNSGLNGNSFLAVDIEDNSSISKSASGKDFRVSPTTSLLMFLTFLEPVLASRLLVTPFDYRSYSIFHDDISTGVPLDMKEFGEIRNSLSID